MNMLLKRKLTNNMIHGNVQACEKKQLLLLFEDSLSLQKKLWNYDALHYERPRKRVRISCSLPEIHRYEIEGEADQPVEANNEKPQRKRNRTWLTREELRYFRSCATKMSREAKLDNVLHQAYFDATKRDFETQQMAAQALAENDVYVAQRGLERLSSSHHGLVRSVKIVEVRTAVFLEQTRQFLLGKKDPALLAMVSREASKSSQQFAQFLACADTAVAMPVRLEYLQDNVL
jgi:hypothetical protein